MSEFQGFAFKSNDRNVFFIKKKKKWRLELFFFVLFETDYVTQADLPWAFTPLLHQACTPLLLAHF